MSDDYSDETRILSTAEFRIDDLVGKPGERSAVLSVLRGRRRGATFQIGGATTVLGRGERAEIRLDDDGVSRRHAELVRLDDGALQLRDLGSTNGTFVNGERVAERVLEDDDRVALGTTTLLKFELHDAMEIKLKAEMYQKATRDQLTGMFNRRYCFERLREEFSFAATRAAALGGDVRRRSLQAGERYLRPRGGRRRPPAHWAGGHGAGPQRGRGLPLWRRRVRLYLARVDA